MVGRSLLEMPDKNKSVSDKDNNKNPLKPGI